jgi:hypothetical protein
MAGRPRYIRTRSLDVVPTEKYVAITEVTQARLRTNVVFENSEIMAIGQLYDRLRIYHILLIGLGSQFRLSRKLVGHKLHCTEIGVHRNLLASAI